VRASDCAGWTARAEQKEQLMSKSNMIKVAAVLAVLVAVVLVLVLGPLSSGEPDPGPDVNLPSMQNIPPSGHLTVEVPPETK
jgi:hypothetical protein